MAKLQAFPESGRQLSNKGRPCLFCLAKANSADQQRKGSKRVQSRSVPPDNEEDIRYPLVTRRYTWRICVCSEDKIQVYFKFLLAEAILCYLTMVVMKYPETLPSSKESEGECRMSHCAFISGNFKEGSETVMPAD